MNSVLRVFLKTLKTSFDRIYRAAVSTHWYLTNNSRSTSQAIVVSSITVCKGSLISWLQNWWVMSEAVSSSLYMLISIYFVLGITVPIHKNLHSTLKCQHLFFVLLFTFYNLRINLQRLEAKVFQTLTWIWFKKTSDQKQKCELGSSS